MKVRLLTVVHCCSSWLKLHLVNEVIKNIGECMCLHSLCQDDHPLPYNSTNYLDQLQIILTSEKVEIDFGSVGDRYKYGNCSVM